MNGLGSGNPHSEDVREIGEADHPFFVTAGRLVSPSFSVASRGIFEKLAMDFPEGEMAGYDSKINVIEVPPVEQTPPVGKMALLQTRVTARL